MLEKPKIHGLRVHNRFISRFRGQLDEVGFKVTPMARRSLHMHQVRERAPHGVLRLRHSNLPGMFQRRSSIPIPGRQFLPQQADVKTNWDANDQSRTKSERIQFRTIPTSRVNPRGKPYSPMNSDDIHTRHVT